MLTKITTAANSKVTEAVPASAPAAAKGKKTTQAPPANAPAAAKGKNATQVVPADVLVATKAKSKPRPVTKTTTRKKVISEDVMEKHSENLAQIEDETAAEHTDNKTPRAPLQMCQQKKGNSSKKAYLS